MKGKLSGALIKRLTKEKNENFLDAIILTK